MNEMNDKEKTMNPIAFSIFGIDIMWYGILISLGIVLGAAIAMVEAKRVGYDSDIISDMLLWTLPAAILGARLYYVLFEWSYFKQHPGEILAIRNGGLAIHGGIIGAFVVGYFFVKVKKLSFFKLADIAAPSLILGQAIGRWGNFMNREAHGGVASEQFISYFPKFIQEQMNIGGVFYHPTFLYESVWNFVVFIALFSFRKHKKNDGELIGLYLILYSIGRFFIEGLRTDSLMLGPLRIAQVVSLLLIALGLILILFLRWFKAKNKEQG
ncbi:MAG: Prolipoprotein diacylglyceryl transferase [Clostridia bacterium]|jgi:phosphatidylglycerol:prolipoprotein diacylglycerol transferase|nr:Prolipoprotein diacylglyceryl transferase [Clostridia bacterium]